MKEATGNPLKIKTSFKIMLPALLILTGSYAFAGEVEDHILSGTKFISDKKMKEALREFQTAVDLESENPEANRLLGLTYTHVGDLDNAAKYSLKAAQLKPAYGVYYLLGLIYSNQAKYDQASTSFEEALKLNPKSYEAWHQLGKVYATTLQFEKAVETYKKAAELNPKFPDAYQGLGSSYYWLGNLTAALQQVDELNRLGFSEKATELERWIKDKETKKKKSASR